VSALAVMPLPELGPLASLLDRAMCILDTLEGLAPVELGMRAELDEQLAHLVKGLEALLALPAPIEEADVDGLWRLLLHFESAGVIAAREVKEKQAMQRRAAGFLERIEGAVQASMIAHQQKKLTGINLGLSAVSLTLQPSNPSVVILDEALIPKEYLRHVEAYDEPDKVKIGAALKKGVEIAGADLSEGNVRLVRK
jgi:hypothetical protein